MLLLLLLLLCISGPKELTGAVDLISHYKLPPHHETSSQCCALEFFFGVINARPLARDLFMACVR